VVDHIDPWAAGRGGRHAVGRLGGGAGDRARAGRRGTRGALALRVALGALRRVAPRAGVGGSGLLGLAAAPPLVVVLEVVVVAAAVVAVLVGLVDAARSVGLVGTGVAAVRALAVVVGVGLRPALVAALALLDRAVLPEGCRSSPASATLFGVPPSLVSVSSVWWVAMLRSASPSRSCFGVAVAAPAKRVMVRAAAPRVVVIAVSVRFGVGEKVCIVSSGRRCAADFGAAGGRMTSSL
jgi:hypothetical protein